MSLYAFTLVVIILSYLLTFFVRKWAIHKSILDLPNDRSSHTIPTPRGGGIAVAAVWFLGLIILFWQGQIVKPLFFALLCGIPLSLIGFLDDVFNLKPATRFGIQLLSALAGLIILGGLQHVDVGFYTINWYWVLFPVALIGIIWSINLFNFLDGIDAYIGSESAFIGLSVYILFGDKLGLLLTSSVAGFLIWNWPKAKIFMGDVGSTLIGFIVAILAIYFENKGGSIITFLILSSVFWFDATITLFRRWRNKEQLSQAHRKHAYQRIVQSGFGHQKTVLWSVGLNILGLILAFLSEKYPLYKLAFLCFDILILYITLKLVDRRNAFN